MSFFMQDEGDTVKRQLQEKALVARLQKERQKFINDTYPAAIALIANISFKAKSKKIEKQKEKVIKEQTKHLHRTCMNLTCNGLLDDKLVCLTCQTAFCTSCEKRLEKEHHCKQDDRDAVNLVNNMVKCPGCKIPVFKNTGCDNITCAYCNANFKYSTGETGGSGSSNRKLIVDLEQKQKLSLSYGKTMDKKHLDMLLTAEAAEPKVLSKDIILLPIKHYIEKKNPSQAMDMLAKKIEAYYLNRIQIRDYQINMVELEHVLQKKPLDEVKFQDVIDKIMDDD